MKKERDLVNTLKRLMSFLGLQNAKNQSLEKHVAKKDDKLIDLFSRGNIGLYNQLGAINTPKQITADDIIRVFGIHLHKSTKKSVDYEITNEGSITGTNYYEGKFVSYDSVKIPFYEILPNNFEKNKTYPTVVLFSGHGNMDEVAFNETSYQKGVGLSLARNGFLVFVMENRGMGKLSYLGDHMRIDAVARMVGGSWYGEITTDALFLLNMVIDKKYTSSSPGVGGVSTGGALSLLTSTIDERVRATFVQGYLGSYKTTFGSRGNHHTCNNISNIINEFDMADIAANIFPRSAIYVNGKNDTFYSEDAHKAFKIIKNRYVQGGFADAVMFKAPEDTKHEISVPLVLEYFKNELRN